MKKSQKYSPKEGKERRIARLLKVLKIADLNSCMIKIGVIALGTVKRAI